jgi:4-amino-4-deoxy-L-arabinose transferase-like glycosyltransferase
MALWPLSLWWQGAQGHFYLNAWWQWNLEQFGFLLSNLRITGRTLLWFCWPAWPIALWTLWSQRAASNMSWRSPQIALPFSFVVCFLVMALCAQQASDSFVLMLLPGLAVLAAFGLARLGRGAINAIDWFAVMVFSLLCLTAWFYWIAAVTGYPARISNHIARLAPGYKPALIWTELIIALAITGAWGWLIYWRISRRPKVLWRSVVLSSGGLVLSWALLMTLWMPWLNYTRTYRDVAQQMKNKLPAHYNCIQTEHLGLAQRVTLVYFADLRFADTSKISEGKDCDFLLLQDSVANRYDAKIPETDWKLRWEGRRAAARDERFRLYRKQLAQ